jgi:aquaglyceroporin related protein
MPYIAGYGHEIWSAGGYYFWIPLVAPFLGCTFGGFLYDFFVYTGPESPVNKRWLGFKHLLSGGYWRKKRDEAWDGGNADRDEDSKERGLGRRKF